MKLAPIFAASALLLSACAATTPTASDGPAFMTQAELLATLPGGSTSGTTRDGVDWTQNYSAGGTSGTITGSFGGAPIASKWSVKGDLWCEDWGDGSACWAMERESANTLRPWTDGTTRRDITWTIN